MNKLLRRQIKKHFGGLKKVSPEVRDFFNIVSDSYDGFEVNFDVLEKSLEYSSTELNEANEETKKESQRQKELIEKLLIITRSLGEPGNKEKKITKKEKENPYELVKILENLIKNKIESEKQIRWLASFPELNPSPIIETDIKGNIYYQNPGSEKVFASLSKKKLHPLTTSLESAIKIMESLGLNMIMREAPIEDSIYQQVITRVPNSNRVRIFAYNITDQKKAEEETKKRTKELEKFNELMVGRELKMIEMKRLIQQLKEEIGELKERSK